MQDQTLSRLGWTLVFTFASTFIGNLAVGAQAPPMVQTDVTGLTSGGGVMFNLGLDQAYRAGRTSQPRRTRSVTGKILPAQQQNVRVITVPVVVPSPVPPTVIIQP